MEKKNESGFVYEWTNIINNKKYIGSHKGKEDDGYMGSGIIFKHAIKKYGKHNFIREILYRGEDFKNFEDQKLKEINAENNSQYYNLKNAAVGGAFFGEKNGMFRKHHKKTSKDKISKTAKENYTEERKIKHSKDISGEKNGNFNGKWHGENPTYKMWANMKSVTCPHCNISGRGPNMKRYHFDKCKKISDGNFK